MDLESTSKIELLIKANELADLLNSEEFTKVDKSDIGSKIYGLCQKKEIACIISILRKYSILYLSIN